MTVTRQEVGLIFWAHSCQWGVKGQIVPIDKVECNKVDSWEVSVLPQNLVSDSEALSDGDGGLCFQLYNDHPLSSWEFSGEYLGLIVLVLPVHLGEVGILYIGGCYCYLRGGYWCHGESWNLFTLKLGDCQLKVTVWVEPVGTSGCPEGGTLRSELDVAERGLMLRWGSGG